MITRKLAHNQRKIVLLTRVMKKLVLKIQMFLTWRRFFLTRPLWLILTYQGSRFCVCVKCATSNINNLYRQRDYGISIWMDGGETRITSFEKKRVVCELLVNPTTKQHFVMKSASIDFTFKSVSFFMLGKLKLRVHINHIFYWLRQWF